MTDRYLKLDDPKQFDPPMYQCKDCHLVLDNTELHDRIHLAYHRMNNSRQHTRDMLLGFGSWLAEDEEKEE